MVAPSKESASSTPLVGPLISMMYPYPDFSFTTPITLSSTHGIYYRREAVIQVCVCERERARKRRGYKRRGNKGRVYKREETHTEHSPITTTFQGLEVGRLYT